MCFVHACGSMCSRTVLARMFCTFHVWCISRKFCLRFVYGMRIEKIGQKRASASMKWDGNDVHRRHRRRLRRHRNTKNHQYHRRRPI